MRHFPVFLKVEGKRLVVAGGGETAVSKIRLLLKTEADVHVYSNTPNELVESWADAGLLTLHRHLVRQDDFYNAAFSYAAEDNPEKDAKTDLMARSAGVLSNIVDNLEDSQFITPALVDRDPVVVAIGTEGTAPVLARKIKAEIEDNLPNELGLLARIAARFRPKAEGLPAGRERRNFWSRFFFDRGPIAVKQGGGSEAARALDTLLEETLAAEPEKGHVAIVGAGPGNPDLLTRKALNLLHEADVVIHDRLVSPQILELARREAEVIETGKKGFGPSWKQDDINRLMVEKAQAGQHVVRLKSGDPVVFARLDEEMDALDCADISFEIVPGITTASAAAANLSVSLTRRNRNSALQLLTAQDIDGFAEQDWRSLAREGAVAAIYMGLKSARFLSGRLLIHGASVETPVTLMENVSRPDQKIITSTLGNLAEDASSMDAAGPVILMLGLEPRSASLLTGEVTTQLAKAI